LGKDERVTSTPASETPDTVTEAVALLQSEGYTVDYNLDQAGVQCACGARHAASEMIVERVFRFEGPSDPADEAIVLGLRCPSCNERGLLVSAFGPDADPEVLAQVTFLARRA
jgi:hypothetical protein